MKKLVIIFLILFTGIITFSKPSKVKYQKAKMEYANFFEGYWFLDNPPIDMLMKWEYKGINKGANHESFIYKVYFKVKENGTWKYYQSTWFVNGYDLSAMTCLNYNKCFGFYKNDKSGNFNISNDKGAWQIIKMTDKQRIEFDKELKTQKWVVW